MGNKSETKDPDPDPSDPSDRQPDLFLQHALMIFDAPLHSLAHVRDRKSRAQFLCFTMTFHTSPSCIVESVFKKNPTLCTMHTSCVTHSLAGSNLNIYKLKRCHDPLGSGMSARVFQTLFDSALFVKSNGERQNITRASEVIS
jgi:hypothetical protein